MMYALIKYFINEIVSSLLNVIFFNKIEVRIYVDKYKSTNKCVTYYIYI